MKDKKRIKAERAAAEKELGQYYERVKVELAKTELSPEEKEGVTEFLCKKKAFEIKSAMTGADPEKRALELASIKLTVCGGSSARKKIEPGESISCT